MEDKKVVEYTVAKVCLKANPAPLGQIINLA
jgi:hypothetical protein